MSFREVKRKNKFKKLINLKMLIFLLIFLFVATIISYAATKNTSITINLSDEINGAFVDTVISLTPDENNQVELPATFANMVTTTVSEANKVDDETFYFVDDWATNQDAYAYTFTGWKVAGSTKNIPGSTVFQPGDIIDLDEVTASPLNLEAIWGKVIFIQNEFNTMAYNKYVLLDRTTSAASGATGASNSNTGRTVDEAIADVQYGYSLFDVDSVNRDPYKNVLMLVGDLDYIKSGSKGSGQEGYDAGWQSAYWGYGVTGGNTTAKARANTRHVTFKSLITDDGNYMLRIKPYNYNFNCYASVRFDNVDMVMLKSSEVTGYSSSVVSISNEIVFFDSDNVMEFTNRHTNSRKSAFTLRTNSIANVSVNGGYFNSWQFNWQTSFAQGTPDILWRAGKKAAIGTVTMGTTAGYATTKDVAYGNVTLKVNGATITNIYGANTATNTKTIGQRRIEILNGKVTNLYGGSHSGTSYCDIEIDIEDSSVTNVYGGGYAYTSNVYGDISIAIRNSTIKNIYGGGYNGNVLVTPADSTYGTPGHGGDVKVDIGEGTSVTGNIFGSGMGGSQTLSTGAGKSYTIESGTYPTDWEKPASGFPQKEDTSDSIITAKYKTISWTSNSDKVVTFYTYTSTSYLSLAMIENVDISISNSTVAGNVYGGGSIAIVNGDTKISVLDGSIIKGNVYGGGDGATKPSTIKVYEPMPEATYVAPKYTVNANGGVTTQTEASTYKNYYLGEFSWSNDTSLLETGGVDIANKLLYSPNTQGLGKVKGNTTVIIEASEVQKDVYAGGNNGAVEGNTNLQLSKNATVAGEVFGGGNNGAVMGSCNVNISSGILTSLYTGGNAGDVDGNCSLVITSGTMDTVFGGGNLGVVGGNTNVIVGDLTNPYVTINDVLYGGGRGSSAEFETVKGTATVVIEGLNTFVQNYGSAKLGKVDGDVSVTFKNYWTGNTTNKYRIMNGIDRATDVYFIDSFVLLENKDENGNLVGIKDITNLHIPSGSGLKVSAPGEIAGNFYGGGTFYLDSEVCLTVRGDIYGESVLVLNPELTEAGNIIKGSTENPYLRIYGTDHSDGNALYSLDPKYSIMCSDEESTGAIIYHIFEDVFIDEIITNDILNISGKHYNDDVATWSDEDFYLMNSDSFSTNFEVMVGFLDDGKLGDKYKNLTRKLAFYTGDTLVNLPVGTNLVLVSSGVMYKYRVVATQSEIPLIDFVQMDDTNIKFVEVNDARVNATLIGGNEIKKSYRYDETFRVIVDFGETEETNRLKQGPYNLVLHYYDANVNVDETTSSALNVIRIEEPRKYNLTYSFDRDWYRQNGVINLDMTVDSDYHVLFEEVTGGKELMAMISLKDEDGNIITLADSLRVSFDGNEITHNNSNMVVSIISGLTKERFTSSNSLTIDMTQLITNELIPAGENDICIDYYLAKDSVLQKHVANYMLPIKIVKFQTHSLICKVKEKNGKTDNELLQINKNTDNLRTIQIEYVGDVLGPKVFISLQKKSGNVSASGVDEFTTVTNSVAVNQITSLLSSQEIEANFNGSLENGYYRLVFDLYDQYSEIVATQALEFNIQ